MTHELVILHHRSPHRNLGSRLLCLLGRELRLNLYSNIQVLWSQPIWWSQNLTEVKPPVVIKLSLNGHSIPNIHLSQEGDRRQRTILRNKYWYWMIRTHLWKRINHHQDLQSHPRSDWEYRSLHWHWPIRGNDCSKRKVLQNMRQMHQQRSYLR